MPNYGLGPRQGGNASALNVSASTAISTQPTTVWTVNVTTAGAVGAIYDAAAVGDVAAGNLIAHIPAVVGTYTFTWPCFVGLVYVPGSAQVVSIAYGG